MKYLLCGLCLLSLSGAPVEKEKWRNNLAANMLYTKSSEVKTAEKYFLSGQSNYRYATHMSLFGRASYEDDRFSGFEYQGTATAGGSRSRWRHQGLSGRRSGQ